MTEEKPVGGKSIKEQFDDLLNGDSKKSKNTRKKPKMIDLDLLGNISKDIVVLFEKEELNLFEMKLVLEEMLFIMNKMMDGHFKDTTSIINRMARIRETQERGR